MVRLSTLCPTISSPSVLCSVPLRRWPLPLLLRFFLIPSVLSLYCYECFDRSRPCSRLSNCSGSACVLYENVPKRTSVAFCLLISPVAQKKEADSVEGCWTEEGTAGIECVCTGQFCNLPRDNWAFDPISIPVVGLKMLQRNPFVDYEYLDDERTTILGDGDETESRPKGNGRKETEGEEKAADDTEQTDQYTAEDLMPMELVDYFEWERRFRLPTKTSELPKNPQDEPFPSPWSFSGSTASPSTSDGVPIGSAPNDTAATRQQSPVGTIRMLNDGLPSAHFGPLPLIGFLLIMFICLNPF